MTATLKIIGIKKGQELNIRKSSVVKTPPYFKIGGNMGYNRSRFPAHENTIEVFKELSKGANWFFWTLVETRNLKTNTAYYVSKNPAEKKKISRAYKELLAGKVLIRIKRGEYLFNPAVLQPTVDNYEEVFLLWSSLI